MAIPIETWYYDVPIVTRLFATGAALVALAVVTPLSPSQTKRRRLINTYIVPLANPSPCTIYPPLFFFVTHQQTGFTNAFQLYFNYELVFYQHQVGVQCSFLTSLSLYQDVECTIIPKGVDAYISNPESHLAFLFLMLVLETDHDISLFWAPWAGFCLPHVLLVSLFFWHLQEQTYEILFL